MTEKTLLQPAIERYRTQGALAEAVGVSQQTISNWHRGVIEIPIEYAFVLEKLTSRTLTVDMLRPDWAERLAQKTA